MSPALGYARTRVKNKRESIPDLVKLRLAKKTQ